MKIDIQSPGLEPNQELELFVYKEVGKLFHLYKEVISSEVCLNLDSLSAKENKSCRIRLVVRGNDLFATAKGKMFEEAITQSAEALKRQIEKSRIKKRKRISDTTLPDA